MKTIYIDREILNQFYNNCQESIAEVFVEYLNTSGEAKISLVEVADNPELFAQKLHYFGSSFTYLGFPQVSSYIKSVEGLYRSGEKDASNVKADLQRLIEIIDEVHELIADDLAYIKQAV